MRNLARAVSSGEIDLDGLAGLADEAVERSLVALAGIGPWTASIYQMEALLRPDVWPATDMALAAGIAEVNGLGSRPRAEEMLALAEQWRPWRSVAARIFWHNYLSLRGRSAPPA